MHAVVDDHHLQPSPADDRIRWKAGGSRVRDSDILSGDNNRGWIRGAGRNGGRWSRIVVAGAGARRSGVDVPEQAASGGDVCEFAVGHAGIGVVQQSAEGTERSDTCGDIHVDADDDGEWTDADVSEFLDAGGEVENPQRTAEKTCDKAVRRKFLLDRAVPQVRESRCVPLVREVCPGAV